jgi:hypothetical protein
VLQYPLYKVALVAPAQGGVAALALAHDSCMALLPWSSC